MMSFNKQLLGSKELFCAGPGMRIEVFEGCLSVSLCKWRERRIASEDAPQHQTFFIMTVKAQRVLGGT